MNELICIGCGCSEIRACMDSEGQPCTWVATAQEDGIGLCSECAKVPLAELLERVALQP